LLHKVGKVTTSKADRGRLVMAGEVGVDVDAVDADERNDGLRDATWPVFEMMPLAAHGGVLLNGSIGSRTAAPFHRQRHHRDRRLAVQVGLDHYLLQLLPPDSLQGHFNDQLHHADVGDIGIFDLAQAPGRQIESGPITSVALPRQALEEAIGSRNLHGTVLKARESMTPLIASLVRALCSLQEPLPDMQAMAAREALITLLSAALKGDAKDDVAGDSPLGTGLRQRIVEFITSNVHVLELSPDSLCRRFKVSRAHLYRAFASDGGVAKVLREIRLDAAYRELTGTARTSRSITEIAYSLGFSSGNQLLRSFRARFGMTPSEARASEQG
jgi:AraC-like DNA-binding protein